MRTTITRSSGGAATAIGADIISSAITKVAVTGLRNAVPFPLLGHKLALDIQHLKAQIETQTSADVDPGLRCRHGSSHI